MNGTVEWKNGWKFSKKNTGGIHIAVSDPKNQDLIIAETDIPDTDWCVIIWKLSQTNDLAIGKSIFKILQCG